MNTQFKTLFTVSIEHGYYGGACRDVRFIIPADTARWLRNGKLLTRILDGRLHVLFGANVEGTALAPIPGKVLRFGLQAANPDFPNFTKLDPDFPRTTWLYRNSASATALDPPRGVTLVGRMFTHVLTVPNRPLTLRLKDGASALLESSVIIAGDDRASFSYDLTAYPAGAYTVEEVSPAGTTLTSCYSEPELTREGVFGILEVAVSSGFYTAAPTAIPAFKIAFDSRQETLNYYVVATAEQASDLDPLSITDAGAGEDHRTEVQFTKIPSASFTDAELSPALLGDRSKQVVLFRSKTAVPRTARARRNIQLMKNTEVLIKHLPQPGPGRAGADIIISVSKP